MPLSAGARLGVYVIEGPLGAGGMGEVYRAKDTRLNRVVAIKVLPEPFLSDTDRLARFEREAQLLASLNHPNIAQVHGAIDEPPALVMELVDGEDLAERIARGPLPIDEAVPVARQIAEALEAAHERGVIHRDLKPSNVKVRTDGTVKVLDFGLAKAIGADATASGDGDSNSPTFTMRATQMGVLMGTAAYMAPEQARAKAVDKRADIWAFGCVLFEMLSGARPFGGEGVTDVLAAVVRDNPDWTLLPATTPAGLRQLIRRCLEKDPKLRLRDIGEARVTLSAPLDERHSTPHAAARPSLGRSLVWLAAGMLVGAAALFGLRPRTADAIPHYTLHQLTELPGAEKQPDISPDGRQIVYTSAASGNPDIYLLRIGGGRAINLTAGSSAADVQARFSPDGDRIAFRSERDGGGLFVMGATGESVRRVTRAGFDPAWSPDGRSLAYSIEGVEDPYVRNIQAALWTVDVASGSATRIVDTDAVQPAWSPGGHRIAYWANTGGQRDIWTVAAGGGKPVAVTNDAATDWSPEWSPDGRWLYFASDRGGAMNLWRVAIDEATGALRTAPQAITNGVRALGYARFSRDGARLVVSAYQRSFDLSVYGFDPARPETLTGGAPLRSPSLGWCAPSPDGTWLACSSRSGQEDLVLMRADGSETRRLTDDVFKDRNIWWSPDGREISFSSTRSGEWEIWSITPDGSGLRQLTDIHADVSYGYWSPDGKRMLAASTTRQPYGCWLFNPATKATAETAKFMSVDKLRFDPASWATDDEIAGRLLDDAGTGRALAVWNMRSGAIRTFDMAMWANGGVSLIAGSRQALVDTVEGVTLFDLATGQLRVILPAAPPLRHTLSRDGRTLLVERERLDGDVWLMELVK